jgi:flagellar basal-body rod modification protein FlgD
MSLASVAAQQTSAQTAAAAGSTATGTTAGATGAGSSNGATALNSLSSNFGSFLNLLLTQLRNQDPTQPVDANSFTTELVQFSEVEQQINTNTSLNTLIQLGQSDQVIQGSAMVGKQVEVSSDHVPLQNGSATAHFTTQSAGTATVSLYDSAGVLVDQQVVAANAGANTWTWDGTDASGATLPDGSYKIAITAADASGNAQTVTSTVSGTATGVSKSSNGALQLQLGALAVDFSQVQSVAN